LDGLIELTLFGIEFLRYRQFVACFAIVTHQPVKFGRAK
jgi:hypothetical protein